jgi:hypothetical protein
LKKKLQTKQALSWIDHAAIAVRRLVVVSVSTLAIAACDSSASSLFDACSCSIRIDREGSRGQRQRRGGMGEDRSPSRSYRHEACHPSTTSSRPAGNPTYMHACIVRECMTDGSLASFACSVAHVPTCTWPAGPALDVVGRHCRHRSILQEHSMHPLQYSPLGSRYLQAAAMHGRMCSCILVVVRKE